MTTRNTALFTLLLAAFAHAQPEIAPDRSVTYRLRAPKATEVLLSGEFLTGTRPLVKDETGLWTLTIGPLEPELYHYNLPIRGVRTIHPGNPQVNTAST